VRRNQPVVEEIREVWRRLGGITPRLGQAELTAWYEAHMGEAASWEEIRALAMLIDRRDFVTEAQLATARALPGAVEIRDRTVSIDYDVEEHDGGRIPVARLRLPEKLARTLVHEELPTLDRALRFIVPRGQRGAVRADDLLALQDKLDLPFTDEERAAHDRSAQRSEVRGHGRHERSGGRPGGGRSGGGRPGGGRPGSHGGRGGGKGGGHRHPGKGRGHR
jgi:hypothetical protein